MWSLLIAKPCDELNLVLMEHVEWLDWSDSLAVHLTKETKVFWEAEQVIPLYSLLATSDSRIHVPALVRGKLASYKEYTSNCYKVAPRLVRGHTNHADTGINPT